MQQLLDRSWLTKQEHIQNSMSLPEGTIFGRCREAAGCVLSRDDAAAGCQLTLRGQELRLNM